MGVTAPATIVYIVSEDHSGSTLLDLLLGSHSRILGCGEVWKIPERAIYCEGRLHRCSCGVPLAKCEYWSEVRGRLTDRSGARLTGINSTSMETFERDNIRLWSAMEDIAEKDIICDSSKDLQRLRKLHASSRFDVLAVHLVRDGRAVAYSFKRKLFRGRAGRSFENYWWAVPSWRRTHRMILRKLALDGIRSIEIRYEDLVMATEDVLSAIVSQLGLRYEEGQQCFRSHAHHMAGGNRMRHERENVIRPDLAYLEELSALEWGYGTVIQARLLRRFGYPLARRQPPSGRPE